MKETCPIGHLMEKDPSWSLAMETQYYVCKICKFHRKATALEVIQERLNEACAENTSHIGNLSQNA